MRSARVQQTWSTFCCPVGQGGLGGAMKGGLGGAMTRCWRNWPMDWRRRGSGKEPRSKTKAPLHWLPQAWGEGRQGGQMFRDPWYGRGLGDES